MAVGESIDRLAAEGIYRLLDARRVMIGRGDPDREVVVVDIGEPEAPLDVDHLTHLDAEGHILDGRLRPPGVGGAVGATLPKGPSSSSSSTGSPFGRLVVAFRRTRQAPPVIRLALATVAHALATTGPAVSHDH